MVPIIFESYVHLGAPLKSAFITAVASSLAVILVTASYASWLHFRQGRLDLRLTLWMGIGTIVGSFAGSHLLLNIDNRFVRTGFGLFLWSVAASLLLPKSETTVDRPAMSRNDRIGLIVLGLFMGTLAALFGIGGTALAVPVLMRFFGISMHRAIAASTSMIVITALVSSVNYVAMGWHDAQAPVHGIGWIDPIAVALFVPGAIASTRMGIRLAQRFSRVRLRNLLLLFQLGVGARFIFF